MPTLLAQPGRYLLVLPILVLFLSCSVSSSRQKDLASEGKVDSTGQAVAADSIQIKAPIESVWNIFINSKDWPNWNKAIKTVESNGKLEAGRRFKWGPTFPKINSEVILFAPRGEIIWIGTMMGTRAIHKWEFKSDGKETKISTEESLKGGALSWLFGRKKLKSSLTNWLISLKAKSENKFSEATSGSK